MSLERWNCTTVQWRLSVFQNQNDQSKSFGTEMKEGLNTHTPRCHNITQPHNYTTYNNQDGHKETRVRDSRRNSLRNSRRNSLRK